MSKGFFILTHVGINIPVTGTVLSVKKNQCYLLALVLSSSGVCFYCISLVIMFIGMCLQRHRRHQDIGDAMFLGLTDNTPTI